MEKLIKIEQQTVVLENSDDCIRQPRSQNQRCVIQFVT